MDSLMNYVLKGGPLMWVLLGFSVAGLAVILERGIVYVSYGFAPDRWLDRVLKRVESGKIDEAMAMARTLAGFDRQALLATKRVFRKSTELTLSQSLAMAQEMALLVRANKRADG